MNHWGNLRPIIHVYGLDACIKYVVDQLPEPGAEQARLRELSLSDLDREYACRFTVYDRLSATKRVKETKKNAASVAVQGERNPNNLDRADDVAKVADDAAVPRSLARQNTKTPAPPADPAEAPPVVDLVQADGCHRGAVPGSNTPGPAPSAPEALPPPSTAVRIAMALIMDTLEEDGRFYLPRGRPAELERLACARLVTGGQARWLTGTTAPGIEVVE